MVTRRGFIARVLAASAATALPTGHVARAIAAEADPEPFSIAPGVDVLDADPRWNSVERYGIDDPRQFPTPDWSWDATGYVFIHDDQTDRATQRRIDLKGYVDGSMRIAIGATHPFDCLHVGRGFTAVYLDPELSAEVWKGLFACSDADAPPTTPFERPPWDDAEYLRGQARIGRMQRYARTENAIEGADEGVYRRFHPEPSKAA